jgi:hypothetical protein
MLGLYIAEGTQHFDHETLQDHIAPHASSNLLFKGALNDAGRSVFRGLIRVHPKAQRTDAYQTNRNLILSPARAPTRSPTWRSRPTTCAARTPPPSGSSTRRRSSTSRAAASPSRGDAAGDLRLLRRGARPARAGGGPARSWCAPSSGSWPGGADALGWVRAAALAERSRRGGGAGGGGGGAAVCLARVEGEVYAFADNCSHRDFPLSWARWTRRRAPSPASGTAPPSTCRAASRPALPPPARSPCIPVRVEGTRSVVSVARLSPGATPAPRRPRAFLRFSPRSPHARSRRRRRPRRAGRGCVRADFPILAER